jgi:hypothetical protein
MCLSSFGKAVAYAVTKSGRVHNFLIVCYRFTKDGVLAEGIFWDDVESLLEDHEKGSRKSK